MNDYAWADSNRARSIEPMSDCAVKGFVGKRRNRTRWPRIGSSECRFR
jgi:hypothetical protein